MLGIDIGGTNLRGAIVDESGNILKRNTCPSKAKEGIETVIKNLTQFTELFKKHSPDLIGIGVPGIIDKKSGLLTQAPNIKGVHNYPLLNTLKEILDIPFILENDASATAVGENWFGAGKTINSMVMLTLGTGLGGGIIINNKLWNGEDGMAGEVGHIIVNPNGPACNCGSSGCIESYVSREALRKNVLVNSELSNLLAQTHKDDIPEALMKVAKDGNEQAILIWKKFGRWLGVGITSIINLLNIRMIVIGGGISNAWELFIEEAEAELQKRGLKGPVERVEIKKASLGDDAGIVGMAKLGFNYLENSSAN